MMDNPVRMTDEMLAARDLLARSCGVRPEDVLVSPPWDGTPTGLPPTIDTPMPEPKDKDAVDWIVVKLLGPNKP